MLYKILKAFVSIGLRFYYREIKILNKSNLPEKGPCIYIANHPNTLMDAWIVSFAAKEPLFFMAKASLFSSPMKMKILKSLNMIPINRREESAISGVSNKDSFEACYSILEQGKSLLIFPEGTSFLERRLRELKSGTARIALEVEKRNNSTLNIKIIPIGLNYVNADSFRGKVLINVGQAISIQEYALENENSPGKAAKKLTEQFRVRLEQVLVNSSEKEDEILADYLFQIFSSKYIKNSEKGVKGDLLLYKKIRDKITEISLSQPWKIEEINNSVVSLKSKMSQFAIRADFLDRKFRLKMFVRQLLFSFIFLLIALPIFLFGFIHNIIQFKLIAVLVSKISKEVEYNAPLTVLCGLFIYPLSYLVFMFSMKMFLDFTFWEQLIYFASMPIFGMLAYSIFRYYKHFEKKWKFVFSILRNEQELVELKVQKEKLRKLVFED